MLFDQKTILRGRFWVEAYIWGEDGWKEKPEQLLKDYQSLVRVVKKYVSKQDVKYGARYVKEYADEEAIKLLSCNTGSLDDGFAQNSANKLNVKVSAPTNYLWATKNGDYFVAGMTSSRMPDMKNIGNLKYLYMEEISRWCVKNVDRI